MGHSEFDPAAKDPRPWNAGRRIGAKRALKPQQVWAIRFWLDSTLPFGHVRFINPSKSLLQTGHAGVLVIPMDRQGMTILVTAIERTIVDVLHRPEIAGGTEEVLKSLALVRYLDSQKVVAYVELLGIRSISALVGWWLQTRKTALDVPEESLERLRAFLPRSKHYGLGAEPGHAALVEEWRLLLPPPLLNPDFEGL